jgi:hypothetical protein
MKGKIEAAANIIVVVIAGSGVSFPHKYRRGRNNLHHTKLGICTSR